MWRSLEARLAETEEVTVAGPSKVHVEHIYPQTPPQEQRWANHGPQVNRFGNLNTFGHRLNTGIKNADFATKKHQAYGASRLEITSTLLDYPDEWSPEQKPASTIASTPTVV